MLESAIPQHLRVSRTQALSTPPNYEPPFPAYSARFPENLKDIVMAVIGAQSRSSVELDTTTLAPLLVIIKEEIESKPKYWEMASVIDKSGVHNIAVIAYWASKDAYTEWCRASKFDDFWQQLDPVIEKYGWFREVFFPPVDRFETVFSDNVKPEGAAYMRDGMSGAIKEHVYWGSARDRLPAAQTDPLLSEKSQSRAKVRNQEGVSKTANKGIRVAGKQNLCVIRSGQDWSGTYPEERKLYLNTMHPVLIKGMNFLRDQGEDVGCFDCRFMDVLDPSNTDVSTDRTFGLAYFDDLRSLEKWSKEHKTHLDIFGRFLQYAKELDGNVSLRLFHEVLVLQPDQQLFEYIGCHPGTGMLVSHEIKDD